MKKEEEGPGEAKNGRAAPQSAQSVPRHSESRRLINLTVAAPLNQDKV